MRRHRDFCLRKFVENSHSGVARRSNPDELMIEVDLCYELDPYELNWMTMIEAKNRNPTMIEGLARL